MSSNIDVRTITMTPLQLILTVNAVSKHIMLEQRDLKRWPADSPEHGDIDLTLAALHDLHSTLITRNTHTLAALSVSDSFDDSPSDLSPWESGAANPLGDIRLEEFDHV